MPFVPISQVEPQPDEEQAAPRRGFTPVQQASSAGEPAPAEQSAAPTRGFTPIEAVEPAAPPPATPDPVERPTLYGPGVQLLPPPGPAETPQPEPSAGQSPFPDWMTNMLSVGEDSVSSDMQARIDATQPREPTRLPHAVIDDLMAGQGELTSEELSAVLQQIEGGQLENPEQARDLLMPLLSGQGRQALDEATLVRQILNEQAEAEDGSILPFGEGTQTFLEGFVKGATFNEGDPVRAQAEALAETGDPTAQALARAQEITGEERRAKYPIQAFTGEVTGSVLPFAQGVRMLRGLRLARGLPAVEQSTAGYVAEGAKVGGPQAFAYRPEGSEDMTATQELAARTLQTGIGVTAGAILDFGALKLGDFASHVFTRLKDKRLEQQLLNEAQEQGFATTEEYLSSLVDFVETPDGVVVRPKQQTAEDLPGEQPPDNPAREQGQEGPTPEDGGGNGAAPAIDLPTEHDLRLRAYHEKARQYGLNDEQAAAFEPEQSIDDLTGFQGRRDREPTIERAARLAEEQDLPAQYIAMDIVNLGGLNKRFSEPGADRIYRDLTDIVQEELTGTGGSVNLFRHGGDEVSAVVVGLPDEQLTQTLTRIRQRTDDYVERMGLADIPHEKAGKGPGTGINFGVAPIEKGSTAKSVIDIAHPRLEKAKVDRDVNTVVSQEAQAAGPDRQADGTDAVYPGEGAAGRDLGTGYGTAPERQTETDSLSSQLREYERLAAEASNPTIKADLQRQADILRARARDERPKQTSRERYREQRRVQPERDDLITAIRKLGGINTDLESDWAERLSHLPRKGFGLPAIEQGAKGSGRSLDDLAEVLEEYGYLSARNVRELEDKLSAAENGVDVWSLHRNEFDEELPTGSSDQDWTFRQVDDLDEVEADFVIDLESGTAVPARRITEDDLYRLIEEERNAQAWFEKERTSASDEGAAGTVRLHERGAGETQGVRDYQPRTEEGSPPVDDDGGFSVQTPRGKKTYTPRSGKQSDSVIFDRPGSALQPDDALNVIGRRIRHVETGSLPSGLRRIEGAEDMAHVIAPIRRDAQESFFAAMTDDAGNLLRVAKLHRGSNLTTTVDPTLIAGVASSTPGARRVWLAHNHPSGRLKQSEADHDMAQEVTELLRGSDIDMEGSLVVGPGGRVVNEFNPDTNVETPRATTAAPRRDKIPVTERRLTGSEGETRPIESLEEAVSALQRHGGDREGVLLLDANNKPVGFLPMSSEGMRQLRTGETGGSRKLFKAMDETNADAFIVRTDSEPAAGNMNAFAERTGKRLLDAINSKGESWTEKRGGIGSQSTFYANPFAMGAGQMMKDIGLHPGRNLAAGFSGGAFGATLSEHEAGSPQWWVDVAYGAGAATGAFQLARNTRLLGSGSLVDNAMSHLGRYIESLPLLGRGSQELRDIKRRQRLMKDLLDRQTESVGLQLLKNFTPAERAMMSDIIERRGIIKDLNLVHRQAQALDEHITFAAERMKELGMLPPDLEAGGYLHRYYAKHLGFDKLFRAAKQQSLSGSYTIARGTDDLFDQNYLSPGARRILNEHDQVVAEINRLQRRNPDDPKLAELKARRKELRSQELHEYSGLENGELKSFIFAKDEVPAVNSDQGYKKAHYDSGLDNPPNANLDNLSKTERVWAVRGRDGERALLHRDWTKAERESWGEIDDAGYRYVRGMAEVSHDLSLATMFDKLAKQTDWVSETPRTTRKGKEWVQVPDSRVHKNSPLKKYGALAGQYVRPDVWNGIRNYGRGLFGQSRSAKIYRGLINKWKLYKTVYNPVTHMNNTYSNIEMLYQGGYNPGTLRQAIKYMREGENNPMWREARDNGLFAGDWSTSLIRSDEGGGNKALDELAEQLRTQPDIPDAELSVSTVMRLKEWWINSRNAVADADSPYKTGKALVDAMARPTVRGLKLATRPVGWAADSAQRLYKFEDELFKMAVYQFERKAGATPTEAVNKAQSLFFDYSDLPEAMKIVRDFPIGAPFISYTYFAVQAIARNAARNPERMLALVAGYEAWNYAAMTAQGMDPGEYWAVTQAEEEIAPPWERGRSLWGAKNTVHMPFLESYRLALGRAHALGNPFMTEAGGREKLPAVPYAANFWGSSIFGGNPTHALLDIIVNEDWKGKEIYKPGAPAEERTKKILNYLYQAWTPSNPAFPGSYHQSKIIEGLANDVRKAREEGKDPGIAAPIVDNANAIAEYLGMEGFTGLNRMDDEIITRDAMLGSVGIKLRPINFDQSQDFEFSDVRQEKDEAADWYRSMVRKHAEGRITDKQMERADQQFDEALNALETKEDTLDQAGDKALNK